MRISDWNSDVCSSDPIVIFVNGAKGVAALQLSRDLDVQYKTAFVLSHKLREAMALEDAGQKLGGVVEVDGAYFGGYETPTNNKAHRRDRRIPANQSRYEERRRGHECVSQCGVRWAPCSSQKNKNL